MFQINLEMAGIILIGESPLIINPLRNKPIMVEILKKITLKAMKKRKRKSQI